MGAYFKRPLLPSQTSRVREYPLFPVLVISLFGPRHGRLQQANFDNSGALLVRFSLIYNFMDSDENMKLSFATIIANPEIVRESSLF
jgi:hypothetical protein